MSKKGFKDLKVWEIGKRLAVKIYKLTDTHRIYKDSGLREQLRRSAISIPSNIAEGDERQTDKEVIRFFFYCQGISGRIENPTGNCL